MVQINFALREVNVKIVYYGPGRSGKTTNLEVIHSKAPKGSIGEMMSIATETDRTLFFDFLPLDLGKVAGMNTKFQLYTVPGQVYYKATRKLVLQGADGVVFVADSQANMLEENLQSLEDLEENLSENGLDINTIPLVLQWNKRDLDNILSVEELNAKLNRWGAPNNEAVAINGDGIFPTLKALARVVIQKLNKEHGYDKDRSSELPSVKQTPPAPAPAAKAPAAANAADTRKAAAQALAAELSGTAPAPPPPPPPPPTAQGAPAAAAPAPPPPAPAPAAAPVPAAPPPPPPTTQSPPAAPAPPPAAAAPAPPPAPAAPPPPASTQKPPPAGSKIDTSESTVKDKDAGEPDAVKREIQKRREESLKKKQEQLERIRKSSRKPIKKEGIPAALIVVSVLIAAALGAIIYYLLTLK